MNRLKVPPRHLCRPHLPFTGVSFFLVLFVSYFTPGVANAGEQYLMETDVSKNETIHIDKENRPGSIKIWGGTDSKIGDWPWMTALLRSREPDIYYAQFCGGALIGSSWVLTAAHCAYGQSPNDIEVAIGAYDLSGSSINRIQVKSIHIHPQYNDTYLQNDIALLEINQSPSQPAVPIFAGESLEGVPPSMLGEMTTAIGWGMADGYSYPYYPEKLRQVDLPVVASSYCNNIYGSPYLLSSQICAGYYEGKDTCVGDSGGPIVSKVDNTWIHVGLVSAGVPCDQYDGWYAIYTRTSSYIDFIKQYVPDVSVHPKTSTGMAMPWLMLLSGDRINL
ncbi:MAG: serine protease [Thermodesulfobacteriota bacterium]|nr:serine protease [Thermodesulfobacteriota bacterium]